MPIPLRDALTETTRGWLGAVPATWRPVFEGVVLDEKGIPLKVKHDPWVPIFPTFMSPNNTDFKILGSPRVAHTFRAFRGIAPSKVRVVVVGQDPYPDVAKATGQAFEQGDLRRWRDDLQRVSSSLQAILLNAAGVALGKKRYLDPQRGWFRFRKDILSGKFSLAEPTELFGAYKKQGVLWLNTTLTISLFRSSQKHQEAHAAYWRPFVDAFFEYLVHRGPNKPLVVGLWGGWAKSFRKSIVTLHRRAGSTAPLEFATAPHPVKRKGFLMANTLKTINDHLTSFGETAVDWLPV